MKINNKEESKSAVKLGQKMKQLKDEGDIGGRNQQK